MAYAAKRSGLEGRVPTPYLLVCRRQSLSERAFVAQRSHKTAKPHLSALGALPQAVQPARKLQAEREAEVRKLVSQGYCTRNLAGPCALSRIVQGPCETSGKGVRTNSWTNVVGPGRSPRDVRQGRRRARPLRARGGDDAAGGGRVGGREPMDRLQVVAGVRAAPPRLPAGGGR